MVQSHRLHKIRSRRELAEKAAMLKRPAVVWMEENNKLRKDLWSLRFDLARVGSYCCVKALSLDNTEGEVIERLLDDVVCGRVNWWEAIQGLLNHPKILAFDRMRCPLCGGGSGVPGHYDFAVPFGLETHLRDCAVMKAASKLGHDAQQHKEQEAADLAAIAQADKHSRTGLK